MRKIQDAHRLWTMKINKILLPVRPIHDSRHFFGIFDTPPLDFHQSLALKLLGIHFSRKITQIARMDLPFALLSFA
jgi:hypothetical protein